MYARKQPWMIFVELLRHMAWKGRRAAIADMLLTQDQK
jgi:Trp operon repressor